MKYALACAAALAVTLPRLSYGQDCKSAVLNPCINSDNLWVHPGASHFVAIGGTETAKAGQSGFGLVLGYQSRPVVLRVFSPGPPGTDQNAIDNQVNATFLWNLGITDRLELGAALPVTLGQGGAGLGPITAATAPLKGTVLRDLRFGVAFAVIPRARVDVDATNAQSKAQPAGNAFAVTARFEMSAPTGDGQAFAGERGAVLVPSIAADYRRGRFFAGSELGLRLRGTSELLGARIGSQAVVGLGFGVDILPKELLAAAAEVRMLPGFVSQGDVVQVGGRFSSQSNDRLAAPAEWAVSVRSAPFFGGDLGFQLSGGSAIPLADDSALTNPRFRFTLGVRYAPLDRDTDGDGVLDKFDACPREPEGFRSKDDPSPRDGCPHAPPPAAAPVEFTTAPGTAPAKSAPAPAPAGGTTP